MKYFILIVIHHIIIIWGGDKRGQKKEDNNINISRRARFQINALCFAQRRVYTVFAPRVQYARFTANTSSNLHINSQHLHIH